MEAFFEQQPLRFSCTRCGRCCWSRGDSYVFLGAGEAERIRSYLGVSSGWFRRRYLERLAEGDLVVAAHGDGRCVFLGADGCCRVYSVRPVQCRTYPFWPELVRSRTAWKREAGRCEGINRGPAIPVSRIRRFLKQCTEAA